jgi:hypothetical protein
MRNYLLAAAIVASVSSTASALLETFDSPVATGPTQAPGVWYTDRYAPAGFTSPVAFGGSNTLQHSISAADGASSRPSGFGDAFYNTQGRKFDFSPGLLSASIDLYVPADWATTGRRMAGFWGTAFDGANNVSFFPIVEFTSNDPDDAGPLPVTPRFRGWNGTGWNDMGLPTGFAYGSWQTLSFELGSGGFTYTVGDLTQFVASASSTNVGNIILQGHNTTAGVSYDIHWDNLSTAAVPEPSAILFGSLMAGVVGFAGRRVRDEAVA